jgi:hypothetical protein
LIVKRFAVVAAFALVGASAFAIAELRARPAPSTLVAKAPEVEPAPPEMRPLPAPVQSQRPVAPRSAPRLRTVADIDRHIAEIEAQSRREHQVSAQEVMVTLTAIHRLADEVGLERASEMQTDFFHKMNRLTSELNRQSAD